MEGGGRERVVSGSKYYNLPHSLYVYTCITLPDINFSCIFV